MSESVQVIRPFIESVAPNEVRRVARPTAREWKKHGFLFFLTALTATFAGVVNFGIGVVEPEMPAPSTLLDYVFYVPQLYAKAVGIYLQHAFDNPSLIVQGALFAVALLAILLAHEFGHYIACRRHGVNATLPFFIPAPPLFLAGTFGAFIKIRSPIPTRQALFDIGIAGPLAGFVVAVPIAFVGILTLQPAPPITGDGVIAVFNDPLLFRIFAKVLGVELTNVASNPFYLAAWIGLLVTSLNLMPVGQLDGGHGTYALFGARSHKWIGRTAFIVMSALAVLGWFWHGSPSGFLYSVLLGVMLRLRHPRVGTEGEKLDRPRVVVAAITLAVFILSFLPFPIEII